MQAPCSARGGFTLLENMMALSLLALSFLFVASVFPASNRSLEHSTHRLAASFVAATQLENARAQAYSALAGDSGSTPFTATAGGHAEAPTTFKWTTTVTTVATGLKDVVVTVTWTDPDGLAESLSVQTRVAQVDP